MLTGDDKLDAINVVLADAMEAWKADANPATTAALTQATTEKTNYLTAFHEAARTAYMQRFLSSR